MSARGNLFEYFGVAAPKLVQIPPKFSIPVYYIMVDERGAVEVSRPVVEKGRYTGFIVRAFVSDGSDVGAHEITPFDNLEAVADDFDVPVVRRNS